MVVAVCFSIQRDFEVMNFKRISVIFVADIPDLRKNSCYLSKTSRRERLLHGFGYVSAYRRNKGKEVILYL